MEKTLEQLDKEYIIALDAYVCNEDLEKDEELKKLSLEAYQRYLEAS